MTKNDANSDQAELSDRLHHLDDLLAQKDAQIAQLEHDLATAREAKSAVVDRLNRQLDDAMAAKNGQIAECLYHLTRMNASPGWQLAKWLERITLAPARLISKLAPNPVAARPALTGDYQKWIALYDTLSEHDRDEITRHVLSLDYKPLISILMAAENASETAVRRTIESLRNQLYSNWDVTIAVVESQASVAKGMPNLDPRIRIVACGPDQLAWQPALLLAKGPFIAFVEPGDSLAPQALYEVAVEINAHRDADIFYSDEDRQSSAGLRREPYFKADWNPQLFLGHNMLGHLCVYQRSLINMIPPLSGEDTKSRDYALALRAVSATDAQKIRHIPAILYHACDGAASSRTSARPGLDPIRRAKQDYLAKRGEAADVEPNPLDPASHRIRHKLPNPAPLVSLIVPTRNRHDLLEPCMDGLLNRTAYEPFEVIIIDHQSDDEKTLALLDRLKSDKRVRVMPYEGAFNYSDMNNKAVAQARGEVIGLINNDVNVIAPDWLSEMVSLALLPENGVIGAKLLFPDGRLQHGGILLGMPWGADHLHKFMGGNDRGYFGRLVQTTNVSAVTGACLVLRKRLFEEVGGFETANLAVTYSDTDLCLKIRAKGYRNVWTPFALLYHQESGSRGSDMDPDKVERARRELDYMRCKWGPALDLDPYFNVNLSLQNPSFALAFPPRRVKPWRAAAIRAAREMLVS